MAPESLNKRPEDWAGCRYILATYLQASLADIQAGVQWYRKAHDITLWYANKYDTSHNVAVGVIAALSPSNRWERNVIDAENVIRVYRASGGSVDDVLAVPCCTYTKNRLKAYNILKLEDEGTDYHNQAVWDILNGPKLTEFYNCIMGLDDDVCIDSHAYSVWIGDRLTVKNVPSIGVRLRQHIKQAYREAAAIVNDHINKGGDDVTAAELQAITWVTHKRIHNI